MPIDGKNGLAINVGLDSLGQKSSYVILEQIALLKVVIKLYSKMEVNVRHEKFLKTFCSKTCIIQKNILYLQCNNLLTKNIVFIYIYCYREKIRKAIPNVFTDGTEGYAVSPVMLKIKR